MPDQKSLNHIAFIMDGNGRWATNRQKKRLEGHKAGADVVRNVLRWCMAQGVPYATFYAFSVENWGRPAEEVGGLMELFKLYFKREMGALKRENVRVRFIGDRSPFGKLPEDVLRMMTEIEADTEECTGITAIFAINYGGRDEITRAALSLALDVTSGKALLDDVDENRFSTYLDTSDLPDVDLVVRTAGEQRLSNFLLWQISYAEFVFVDKLWPDLDEVTFRSILSSFASRERRFGRLAGDVSTVSAPLSAQKAKVEAF